MVNENLLAQYAHAQASTSPATGNKWVGKPKAVEEKERRSPRGSNTRRSSEQTHSADLRAPITSEIERQLKQLVVQFGEKQVLEALDPLVTKRKWNDWQCVANAIRRIARKS